jgi:hypothetical protein
MRASVALGSGAVRCRGSSKPRGGNVAMIASTTRTTVQVNTGPDATSRDLQRACNTPHASSQTIVANVVRPVTPPAGPYHAGAG